MKKFSSIKQMCVGALAAVSFAGMAQAADFNSGYTPPFSEGGWYLRGDLGWSWLNWSGEDDSAFTYGGGAGFDYGNGVRTDLRVDRAGTYDTTNVVRDEKFKTTTMLINGYYDFQVSDIASPYIGLGLGWGWTSDGKIGDDDGLAYAAMAGLNLRLADAVMGDVGYRLRDVKLSGDNVTDHSIMAGVRFGF